MEATSWSHTQPGQDLLGHCPKYAPERGEADPSGILIINDYTHAVPLWASTSSRFCEALWNETQGISSLVRSWCESGHSRGKKPPEHSDYLLIPAVDNIVMRARGEETAGNSQKAGERQRGRKREREEWKGNESRRGFELIPFVCH